MRQNRLLKIAIALLFIINNMVVFGQMRQEEFRFTSFETEKNEGKVVLNWTTNEGEPSNYFEVERSLDGKKFRTIMVVLGPDPVKMEEENYKSIDKTSTKNKAYYRLKHINKEGIITFSLIKSTDFNH